MRLFQTAENSDNITPHASHLRGLGHAPACAAHAGSGAKIKARKDMATNPIAPESELEEIDPETERIILERLATFDQDIKDARPWPEVKARILEKLKTLRPR
jgi:hypothetical protein